MCYFLVMNATIRNAAVLAASAVNLLVSPAMAQEDDLSVRLQQLGTIQLPAEERGNTPDAVAYESRVQQAVHQAWKPVSDALLKLSAAQVKYAEAHRDRMSNTHGWKHSFLNERHQHVQLLASLLPWRQDDNLDLPYNILASNIIDMPEAARLLLKQADNLSTPGASQRYMAAADLWVAMLDAQVKILDEKGLAEVHAAWHAYLETLGGIHGCDVRYYCTGEGIFYALYRMAACRFYEQFLLQYLRFADR